MPFTGLEDFIDAVLLLENFNILRRDRGAAAANQVDVGVVFLLQFIPDGFKKRNMSPIVGTDPGEMDAFLNYGVHKLFHGQVVSAQDHFDTAFFKGIRDHQHGGIMAVVAFHTHKTANFVFCHKPEPLGIIRIMTTKKENDSLLTVPSREHKVLFLSPPVRYIPGWVDRAAHYFSVASHCWRPNRNGGWPEISEY